MNTTLGKRMAALPKERKMTQEELAKLLITSISVIGRYERDEMIHVLILMWLKIFLTTYILRLIIY